MAVRNLIEHPAAEITPGERIAGALGDMLNSTRELLDRRLSAIPAALDLYVGHPLVTVPDEFFLPLYCEILASAWSREFPVCDERTNGVVGLDGPLPNILTFRIPYLQAKGVLEIIGAVQERSAVSEAIGNVDEKSVCEPQRPAGLDVILHPTS